ncbi:MFS transporter [Corynebacterium lubricantis]|uniref:MFS transporter n=1 Tax=Corynebacterium lubricantis TaxID=541095 RepID=UPI00035D90D5|nr:MFS transporter [Corynebacterium lubricantis]
MATPDPREVVTTKALTVWTAACIVYIVAILGRTSFGVASVDAIDRFQVDASRIAVFTSVQVGVYALSQIPMGLLIDRFGPRRMLVAGALIMAIGQIMLGFTTNYWVAIAARVLIGMGDATAFLSVMRILPYWFPLKKTPVFTQLTASFGQIGQFLSAVPFLWLLNTSGWTVAFVTLGAIGILVSLAAFVAVADAPEDSTPVKAEEKARSGEGRVSLGQALKTVLTSAICWQAFFIHGVSMLYVNVFALLWGMPLMTLGMGIPETTAGLVLLANTIAAVIAGPIMGIISARAGNKRTNVVFIATLINTASWVVFFLSPDARGLIAIVVLNIIMAFATPAANFGFDQIREKLPNGVVATGTGFGNMGGFLAAMIAAQLVGFLLDFSSNGQSYEWTDFRFAWLAVFAVWFVYMIGLITTFVTIKRKAAQEKAKKIVIVDEAEPQPHDDDK